MELLVITLVQANPAREADALAHIRMIAESVRNAPGLLNARFYHGRAPDHAYLMLTTWESPEWWQRTQERHDPRLLLLTTPPGIFLAPPDQWLMEYLWGYSRPLAQSAVVHALLALVRSDQVAQVQQRWLESLRQQAVEPILSFALLARTIEDDAVFTSPTSSQPLRTGEMQQRPAGQRPMFLNLLSWPSEIAQEDFATNQYYRAMQSLLNNAGFVRVLKLDPL